MERKVIILTEYALDLQNGAAYSRMLCYSRACPDMLFRIYRMGLKSEKENEFVRVTENLEIKKGCVYPNSYTYRNFFKLFDFVAPLKLISQIRKESGKEPYTVLLYSSHFFLFLSAFLCFRFDKKVKLIVEKNELELGIVLNQSPAGGYQKYVSMALFPVKIVFAAIIDRMTRYADGIITISTGLERLYQKNKNLVTVPILVDTDRFSASVEKMPGINLLYIGALTKKKDGLSWLISMAGQIKSSLPDSYRIDLIGTGSKKVVHDLLRLIKDTGIEDKVRILPEVSSAMIPAIIGQYRFGLLTRSRNLQTKYGFATKLGEYLAAGLPVITTSISDNQIFLTDRIDSLIVGFSDESLKDALMQCVSMTDEQRNNMSDSARRLALEKFHYRNYSHQLIKILK